MPIQDSALNQFYPTQSSQMLGYIPPSGEVEETALGQIKLYRFLLQCIRDEDQANGRLLERFYEGIQESWEKTIQTALDLPKIWDVANLRDELLEHKAPIVGWAGELKKITDRLSASTLRRLIQASAAFWKGRGPEDEIESILGLLTGARLKTVNWFDYRWVLGETSIGSGDFIGDDTYALYEPGADPTDVRRFEIRIVDDGSLDRAVVRGVAEIVRPINERVDVVYLRFLDQFLVDDDLEQWALEPGTVATVTGGELQMLTSAGRHTVTANVELAEEMSDYVLNCRINGVTVASRGGEWAVRFYQTGVGDFYEARFHTIDNTVVFAKNVNGIGSLAGSTPLFPHSVVDFDLVDDYDILDDVWFNVRIEAFWDEAESKTRVRIFVDNVLRIEETDESHTRGTIGFYQGEDATIKCSEVELFRIPLEIDRVDINGRKGTQ